MKASQLLSGAAKAASYNMVLQLSTRVLTFVLNAFILRYISRDMLGVVNVRLTLLYSTSIFITREAFNKACLSHTGKVSWSQIINLLWLTVPLAIVGCSMLSAVWIYLLERPDSQIVPYYDIGVAAFALSTVVEVMAQPLWVIGQAFMFIKLRVLMDSLLLAVKAFITVFLVIYKPHLGLIIFSLAQVASMMVYVGVYYLYFTYYLKEHKKKSDDFPLKSVRDFFPKIQKNKPFIDAELSSLTWSFMKQSLLKQLLTEGERYVMTVFRVLSFAEQGVYDIVHNLGSLAARFIFCPIEESGYLFFSQLLHRGKSLEEQTKESASLAPHVLNALLKGVTLVGVIILVYGYSYAFLALDIYGGSMLSGSSGPTLLRWYSLYVLVIAVNGVSECFVFAAMSKQEVDRYNSIMLVFSVLFLAASWVFTQFFGSVGFILANCLNMLLRIVHSSRFIWYYFQKCSSNPLRALVISPQILVGFIVTFGITYLSESLLCCDKNIGWLLHIAIGGCCLLVNLLTIVIFEKKWISFIRDHYMSQKNTSPAEQNSLRSSSLKKGKSKKT